MNLQRYNYFTDPTYESFTFDSVGPKGTIRKVVFYQLIPEFVLEDGRQVINMGFGDWNEKEGRIDDSSATNNSDRDKVLSTVASTIFEYTNKHGNLPIYAEGVTASRTRLYQMGINAHLEEIEKYFHVYGVKDDNLNVFKRGVNYEAFIVIRK